MAWKLRYASHVGYLSPDEPLFRDSVASSDLWDHVAFAAKHDFNGVLYPWAISRPAEEVARFRDALRHFDLRSGCIVFAPLDIVLTPLWVRSGTDARIEIDAHLHRSIPLAKDLGSRVIAVLVRAAEGEDRATQEAALVDHLRWAGDRAAAAGLIIGIEHMVAIPGMLLTDTPQAVEIVERTGHPAVRLIFDTGHVQAMDGDVIKAYRAARSHIGLIQLADMPGRVEPGAGSINFVGLLAEAVLDGHAKDLVELEHGWSAPGAEVELAGIEALRQIDAAIAAAIDAAIVEITEQKLP